MKCNRYEEEESVGTRLHALTGEKGWGGEEKNAFKYFRTTTIFAIIHKILNKEKIKDQTPMETG
jgi:hypothetical protein